MKTANAMQLKALIKKKSKELKALEQVKKAQANLAKVRREEKAKARKEQDHHKFIMGGIVAKYFTECYEFPEQEMNRILACAFKNRDILNMITTVVKERKTEAPETAVYAILKQKPDSSREEISEKISKTVRTVQRALDSLKDKGYIKREGSRQYPVWQILK